MIMRYRSSKGWSGALAACVVILGGAAIGAQQAPTPAQDTLSDGPRVFDSSRRGPSGRPIPGPHFRVVPMKGLTYPYALAFLPNGEMLITERPGRLRGVHDPVLDPQLKGLNDVALHPRFAENKWVYFTYYKPAPNTRDGAFAVLARGRFDGDHALTDVRDLFLTKEVVGGPSAARFVFGRDGKIYLAIGIPIPTDRPGYVTVTDAQNPGSHFGKIWRLNDDGSAPSDNPFVGRPGYKPEIYALGIRNAMGIIVHPETGEIWENENGPQGG